MNLIMYCRKEPARDGTKGKYDVVLYRDAGRKPATIPCGRYTWDMSNKPTRRNRWVTFNCYRYEIKWLDHMGKPV